MPKIIRIMRRCETRMIARDGPAREKESLYIGAELPSRPAPVGVGAYWGGKATFTHSRSNKPRSRKNWRRPQASKGTRRQGSADDGAEKRPAARLHPR